MSLCGFGGVEAAKTRVGTEYKQVAEGNPILTRLIYNSIEYSIKTRIITLSETFGTLSNLDLHRTYTNWTKYVSIFYPYFEVLGRP